MNDFIKLTSVNGKSVWFDAREICGFGVNSEGTWLSFRGTASSMTVREKPKKLLKLIEAAIY